MVSLFYFYNNYSMVVSKLSIWQKIQTIILILFFFIGLIALVYAISLPIRERKNRIKERSGNKQRGLKSRTRKIIESDTKDGIKSEEDSIVGEGSDKSIKESDESPCFSEISASLFVDEGQQEESEEYEGEEPDDESQEEKLGEEESEESEESEVSEDSEESEDLEESDNQYALRVFTKNDNAGLVDFRDNEFKLKNYSISTGTEAPVTLSKGESIKVEAKTIISIDFGINFKAPAGYHYILHDNKTLIQEKGLVPLTVVTEGLFISVNFMALKDVDITFDDELYTCRFVKE